MSVVDRNHIPLIDPLCSITVPSSVLSLCFISKDPSIRSEHESKYEDDGDGGSDSDSDNGEIEFRTSRILHQNSNACSDFRANQVLSQKFLLSCDKSGRAILWDLNKKQSIHQLELGREGPGLAVKRTNKSHICMAQTRDPNGTVSMHALDGGGVGKIIYKYETFSQTFCQGSPCKGDPHLFALPSRQDSVVTIIDDRDASPVMSFSNPNHGMLTSLSMSHGNGIGRPIVACGMESGSICFHDFTAGKHISKGEINLGKDPVLALDLVPSEASPSDPRVSSVLAATGMAGDAAELSELPKPNQGTVALIKASCDDDKWSLRFRSRMLTCRIDERSFGKPGVSVCRFRPDDARVLAVGGWDYRVRVFDRLKGSLLAILRGHRGSVNALDWAPDASASGLLASSGGDDNQIYLWNFCRN